MSALPALTGDKDQSLQAALSRMLSEYEAAVRRGDVGGLGPGLADLLLLVAAARDGERCGCGEGEQEMAGAAGHRVAGESRPPTVARAP